MKRLVLNFPGFETTTSVHQIERLSAGAAKTGELWGFDVTRSDIEEDFESQKTVTQFTSAGKDWQSETRYVHFSWGDIIAKYESVPYPKNLIRHLPGYLAFFLDGTVRKYRKASIRYWAFTVYPILLMILFGIGAWFAGSWISGLFGTGVIAAILIAIILFLVFCKFPGDRFYVNLSVNDWAFARDMCLSANPEIENRYALFAKQVAEEIANSDPDEILVVGHSFGSVWAVMALNHALTANPDLMEGKRVTFLALGSSLLKIALVKKAAFLRTAISQLLSAPNLLWHEIQTKSDFVSFYKSDPFAPLGITPETVEVIVHRVNFKKALSKRRHRKMMKSMYLAHRQYILYCDKPVHHDYQLRVFGPFFADDLARNTELAIESPLLTKKLDTE